MIRKSGFWLTLGVVSLCFTMVIMARWSADRPPQGSVAEVGPDVRTVAAASVELLRQQARLTVLTSTLRADATSRVSRYGMSAELMSVARAEARLGVNLAGLRADALEFDGRTLTVTVRRSLLTVERGPLTDVRHVELGGLLLVSGAVRQELETANARKLETEIESQAKTLRPLAEAQAVATLRSMLELPLRAVGSRAVVVVRVG